MGGKVESAPPRHLSSACGQIVNFLGTLQNEWAGAQAFSSFDTYMAPFIRKDRLDYATVKQCVQELIYNLNVPSRWGTQTPFTNLTFDWTCPEDLKGQTPLIVGEEMPFTYGELAPEMAMINRAYIEVMTAGDAKGRVFTFPIPTYNITKDFDWDGENVDAILEAVIARVPAPRSPRTTRRGRSGRGRGRRWGARSCRRGPGRRPTRRRCRSTPAPRARHGFAASRQQCFRSR